MKPKVKRMAIGGVASGAMLNAAKTAASSMKKAPPAKDIGTGSPTTPRPKGVAPSVETVTNAISATVPRPVKPSSVPVKDIGKGVVSLVRTALGARPRASMFKKGGAVKKKTTTRARKK